MDKKTQENQRLEPDYVRIYNDLIKMKFPEYLDEFEKLLQKEKLSFFEITQINKRLFGNKNRDQKLLEQKYRAYNKQTILKMLRYQQKHNLNNSQLANHFKLSRNTVAKWKKKFNDKVFDI